MPAQPHHPAEPAADQPPAHPVAAAGQTAESGEIRLQSIEAAIAFLQHDVDSLSQSILNCLRRLQEFDERFTRIEHELITFQQQPERRDPAAEKPPHY
ncbi:MAG: SlyX family protein [Planctomyces sp.]